MLYLLIFFSFLIHGVTFIIIRQLKIKQDNMEQIEINVNQQVKNMEDTLAIYLVEIREENERFMKQIERVDLSEQPKQVKNSDKENSSSEDPQSKNRKQQQVKEYQPISTIDSVEDVVESSSTASVLHMQEKGYTVDEIAKKLNKGKTEIELLLKFQQKK